MTMARRRLWTLTRGGLNLVANGAGGQQHADLGANLQTGLGLSHLAGYTVVRTYLHIVVKSSTGNVSVADNQAQWGIGIFAAGIDDGDFPSLALHEGDWLSFGTMIFQGPGVALTPVAPTEASVYHGDSKSARRIDRVGEAEVLVVEQDTSDDYTYKFQISQLWLMP